MLTRLVKMEIREEELASFRELMRRHAGSIRSFEGCEHLEILYCPDRPGLVFTYSKWRDAVSLEHYRRSDLFRSVWGKTREKFSARPAAWSLEELLESKIDNI